MSSPALRLGWSCSGLAAEWRGRRALVGALTMDLTMPTTKLRRDFCWNATDLLRVWQHAGPIARRHDRHDRRDLHAIGERAFGTQLEHKTAREDEVGGSVRRAAVDQDQLEVLAGLPGDAVEASTRGRRHVTVLIDTQVG